MSVDLNELRHDLVEIATVAYGSGWRENTSGGEGHIGKIGKMIVKFNTHGDEYGNLSTLSDELRKKMLASSDPLRETIIAIIDKALGLAGDGAERSDVLKEMKAALELGKGKDLLTRKTAARAVTEIARLIDKAKPELKREQNGVSFKRSVWNEAKMNVKGAYMQSAKDTRADFEAKYDDYFERKAVASADMKRLKAFAALACGKDASSSGGSGYMGVRPDGTAVKFLTHPGERSAFARSGRDFPDSAVRASEKMKTELLELARGFQRLKEANGLFDEFEKDPANKGRPYTRELVAKVIDAIAKDNLAKTENGERFKWENIRHADTVGDTTMETVFADELVESIMKDVWERPEADPQTCGYTRTMAVEGDVQENLGKALSVFSHSGDDEKSRQAAFTAFQEDFTRGNKLFIDGTDVSGVQDSLETTVDKFFKTDGANGAAAKNAVVQLASQQLYGPIMTMLSGYEDLVSGIDIKSPFPFNFTCTNEVEGESREVRLSRDDKGGYHLDVKFSGSVLMLLADGGALVRNFAETGTNPTKMSVSLTLDLSFNEQGAAVVTVAKGGCISVQIPPQDGPQSEPKADGGRADRFRSYQMEIRNRAQEIRDAEVQLGTMTNDRATLFDERVRKFANDEAAACGLDARKFKDSTALHKSLLDLRAL